MLMAAASCFQTLSAQNAAVSPSEAEKLSMELELSISKGNPEVLNHLIYLPEFIARTKSKSPIIDNMDTLTKIADGFGLFHIGNGILDISKNGCFQVVHVFVKNEETHLLLRAFGDEGLNYMDVTLIKIKDSIRAADIFSYTLGESYVQLFSYLIADQTTPDAHTSMTAREKYGNLFENAIAHKNYAAAKSAFEKLDERTQNDRHFAIQYLLVCKELNEKLFRKSADRFISLFPDEPTPYLLMINEYTDSKDFGVYGMAIDKLDTLLHVDPFLNYFRGNVEMKLGNTRAGLHFYQVVFDYDPGIWQNTEKLVSYKVVNNELVQANEAIKLYTRTPGYRKELVDALYENYPALK